MKKFFDIDSKPMQLLSKLFDLFLLNGLYILCCIPIVTIGAAQAGMYRAIVAMRDPESDYTWTQAFFMGFKDGFWRITIVSTLVLLMTYLVGANALAMSYFEEATQADGSMLWASYAGGAMLMVVFSTMTLFHSRFGCTAFQLFRNSIMMIIFNLWRCLVTAALTWLPLVIFLVDTALFIKLTPLWLLGFYAIGAYITNVLFRVPFAVLEKNYKQVNGLLEEENEEEASEEAE